MKKSSGDLLGIMGLTLIYHFNTLFLFIPYLNIACIAGTVGLSWFKVKSLFNTKYDKLFKACNIKSIDGQIPKLLETSENSLGKRLIFTIPDGYCLEDFIKIQEELETMLMKPIKLSMTNNYKLVIQFVDKDFKSRYKPDFSLVNGLKYPVGVELSEAGERPVMIDLKAGAHSLIGGINNSGKTSVVKCLLTYFCLQDLELHIIDMKMGGDYNVYKKYHNLKCLVKSIDGANEEIENIQNLMTERFNLLDKKNCKDYSDYNKRFKDKPMKPIILVIDEFSMLTKEKGFNKTLNIILAMSRAVNIKVLLIIQRPCHENLDSRLKANLNNTIAFMCKNSYNSEILLDKGDNRAVTDLHSQGEAIIMTDQLSTKFKSYYLEDKEIREIIKDKLVKSACEKRVVINTPRIIRKADEEPAIEENNVCVF